VFLFLNIEAIYRKPFRFENFYHNISKLFYLVFMSVFGKKYNYCFQQEHIKLIRSVNKDRHKR